MSKHLNEVDETSKDSNAKLFSKLIWDAFGLDLVYRVFISRSGFIAA